MTHFRFFILSLAVLISATYIAVKYPTAVDNTLTTIKTIME